MSAEVGPQGTSGGPFSLQHNCTPLRSLHQAWEPSPSFTPIPGATSLELWPVDPFRVRLISPRPADLCPRGLVLHLQLRDAPIAHQTYAHTVLHSNYQHPAHQQFQRQAHHLTASKTDFVLLRLTTGAAYLLARRTPLLSGSKCPEAPHPLHSGPLIQSLLHLLGPLIPFPCACLGGAICSLSTNHFLGPKKEGSVVGVGSEAKVPLGSRG